MSALGPHRSLLDRTFFISLILKGVDGVLELVGGLLLLVVTPAQIGVIGRAVTQHELSQDPHDFFANALVHWTGNLNLSVTLFGAIYLLLHGVVKIVLVWAVLHDHLWAYPWLIAFLVIFIVYQGYELVVAYSLGLLLLTAFDIFIVFLTWREYGIHKTKQHVPAAADAAAKPSQDLRVN